MKINVLTLFPDMFTPLQVSMLGRGLEDKKWKLNLVNFRNLLQMSTIMLMTLHMEEGLAWCYKLCR